jgi:hypothetical protein
VKEETVIMLPQTQEHLELPETGRGKEGSSPRLWIDHSPADAVVLTLISRAVKE